MRWDGSPADTESPTRQLARTLLYEALAALGEPVTMAPRASQHRTPRQAHRHWTRAAALDTVAAFYRQQGRFPTSREWDEAAALGLPSPWGIVKHFGTREGCRQAVRRHLGLEG